MEFVVIYVDLMGIYVDLMVIYMDLIWFIGDSIVNFKRLRWCGVFFLWFRGDLTEIPWVDRGGWWRKSLNLSWAI